jgi:hypothetical protein
MRPAAVAAIIAGRFSVATLIGTVFAQVISFRSTRASTERQINATHKDTADTLAQQREQLLCAYLRMPHEPDPGEQAPAKKWLDFHASREVRRTVTRVITAHLRDGAAKSWQGLNFDFTDVRSSKPHRQLQLAQFS